jgi:hypothetical protein
MLANKKIGHWCWALSGEEAMAALVVDRATREGTRASAAQRRLYAGMLEKQKKLSTLSAGAAGGRPAAIRWTY